MAGGLFRGVRAPASLKLGVDVFMGDDGPGLFRGVRAPASLKRALPEHDDRPGDGALPGRTRPGLIEASGGSHRFGSRRSASLPGRTRPGLIEASRFPFDLAHSAVRPCSSGAYAPRPH